MTRSDNNQLETANKLLARVLSSLHIEIEPASFFSDFRPANNSVWMDVSVDPLRYLPAVKGLSTRVIR